MAGLICIYIIALFVELFINAKGSCFEIETVKSSKNYVTQSPVWSQNENALYWVQTFEHTVRRMDLGTGEITSRHLHNGCAYSIVSVRDYPGHLVVAMGTGVYLLKWGAPGGDMALRLLTILERDKPDNCIIYMKTDAIGRLWIGTMGKLMPERKTLVSVGAGSLYTIDSSNYTHPIIRKRQISVVKGAMWSPDNKKMYFIDAFTRNITSYDFDLETGSISNETTVFNFDDFGLPGIADGSTMDADGNIWVTTFASKIVKVNPRTGQLLQVVEVPGVDQTTAVVWGGPDLDVLYVTTAAFNSAAFKVPHPKPMSGSVLKITKLGTRGLLEKEFLFPNADVY